MPGPYDNLNPMFSSRLQAFINASGGLVTPGSGYRTNEQQAALYNAYKAGVPGQARAAPPGKSQHNHGLAMDLQFGPGGQEWAHQHAAEFGLYFPMDDEPWHIQPAGIDSNNTTMPGVQGYQAAGIDPKDELASRLQSIMGVLAGGPKDLSDDEGNPIEPDPSTTKYLSNMFGGGELFAGDKATKSLGAFQGGAGDPGAFGQYALQKFKEFGWSESELVALTQLWNRESGDRNSSNITWNPQADNPTSSAAGIAQKMQSVHGPVESTWQGQIDWGLQYIAGRYGSPSQALQFHNKNNWY